MEALQADLKTIGTATKGNPALLAGDQKTRLDETRMNLSQLTRDASKGAHNFLYATKIMDKAEKDIAGLKAAIGH